VKHGYVSQWQDWPFSSAKDFLDEVGREQSLEFWENYPVLDMGKGWDWDE
jgi:putative transposase